MSSSTKRFYEFGDFRIDTVNRLLFCNGEAVPLKSKAVEMLLLLIQHNGEVVEKDELMKQLWPDSFVEEANLTQNVYMLRKALGERQYIETIPRRGYRFAAEVKSWDGPASDLLVIKEKTTRSITYEKEVDEAATQLQIALPATSNGAPKISQTSEARSVSRREAILVVCALLAVMSVAYFFRSDNAIELFKDVRLMRFTTSGKAHLAAISDDGKYLAHVLLDQGQQSIRLTQVMTGQDLEIVPPAHVEIYGLTFSHDGNYIYYVSQETNRLGMLFQVPTLGGAANKLAEDVDSAVTVSPDDKSVAFIRLSPTEHSIIVCNVDGSGERRLASTSAAAEFRIEPSFLVPPAWSPDGKVIACPVGISTRDDEYQTVWQFNATDGSVGERLTSHRWQVVGKMQWLAVGRGMAVAAADKGGNMIQQLWYVSVPDGNARRITNDLNDYTDLSIAADGRTIVAVQSERRGNIWLAPAYDLDHPRQITFTNYDALDGLAWTADGKLIYTQQSAGEQNLWLRHQDGNISQLTKQAGFNLDPTVSPDGRYIVFASSRSGRLHLWRIDIDGKHPLELTHGEEDRKPSITSDGKSVLYRSYVLGAGARIFKVPIEGGDAVAVVDKISADPAISPDGQTFAMIYRAAPAEANKLAVMKVAGGDPQFISDYPAQYGRFRWTVDGTGLAYADKHEGIGNIWIQPIDGSAPSQLTHWLPDPILAFDWSRDGKWFAFTKASLTSDVVWITDRGR